MAMMGKAMPGKRQRGLNKRNKQIGGIRQAEALRLRLEGLTCREIGQHLHISEKNAWKHLRNALAAKGEEVNEMRTLSAGRLDRMLTHLWTEIDLGDSRSVQAAVAVEKRRADLFGLDAAKGVEISGKDGAPLTLDVLRKLAVP